MKIQSILKATALANVGNRKQTETGANTQANKEGEMSLQPLPRTPPLSLSLGPFLKRSAVALGSRRNPPRWHSGLPCPTTSRRGRGAMGGGLTLAHVDDRPQTGKGKMDTDAGNLAVASLKKNKKHKTKQGKGHSIQF